MRPKYFETFARKIIAKKNGSCSLGNTLLISTEIKQQIWNQHHRHKSQVKFCQDQKVNTFWAKMSKFGDLCLKLLKTVFRFEISTFEIEYSQNFIKNRKLILFGPNAHIWRFELCTFQNEYEFEISTFEWSSRNQHHNSTCEISLVLGSYYFFVQNIKIFAFGLEILKNKDSRKFQISPTLKLWVVSDHFAISWAVLGCFGLFRLVLAHLG